jgi:C-terminal processing protease CtpA/Prc
MNSKVLFFVFSLIIGYSASKSQLVNDGLAQPFNLGFEFSPEGKLPTGWWINDDYKQKNFVALATREQARTGQQSILIVNSKFKSMSPEAAKSEPAAISQTIDAHLYRGRKLRVSVFGKGAQDAGDGFRIWIKDVFYDNEGGSYRQKEGFISTTEWTKDEIEFTVNKNADMIAIGVETRGKGPYFFDDFNIEYADREDVENIALRPISEQEKKDIYNLGVFQYTLKAFHPGFEAVALKWNGVLHKSVSDIIAGKDLVNILEDNYTPYLGGLKVSKLPIEAITYPREKKFSGMIAYSYMHKGIYNPSVSDPLASTAVNIYQPILDQQLIIFKSAKLAENTFGQPVELSAMVKTDPVGPGSHAQLWIRYTNGNNTLKTRAMYDDMVRSKEWTKVRLTDTVPMDAEKISIVLTVFGNGSFWFDDVKLGFPDKGITTFTNLENDDFDDDPNYPVSWNIADGAMRDSYRISIDKEESYNGNALKVWTAESGFKTLASEGTTKVIELGQGSDKIYYRFPLSVYSVGLGTYPKPEFVIEKVSDVYNDVNYSDEDLVSRLAIVSDLAGLKETFDFVDLSDEEINKLFDLAVTPGGDMEALVSKAIKYLDDPSAKAWNLSTYDRFTIPAYLEAVTGEYIVVSNTYNDSLFHVGDRIIKINGKNIWDQINAYIDETGDVNKILSLRKALLDVVSFPVPTRLEIGLIDTLGKERKVDLEANYPISQVSGPTLGTTFKFDENTAYIDLRSLSDKDFKSLTEKLENYSTLIFDLRGKSTITEYMLGYFIDEPIENVKYKLKIFTEPMVSTDTLNFGGSIKPLDGLGGKSVYFLIDERTSGGLEQIAFLAKENNLGTLVGMPTSGTIGQTNITTLPGDYNLVLGVFQSYYKDKYLKGLATVPDVVSATDIKSVYLGYDSVVLRAYQHSKTDETATEKSSDN